MSNELQAAKKAADITSVAELVHDEGFVKKAQYILGEGTQQFMSSVLTLANSDATLKSCDPIKLYNCCLMSAAIKLPFNKDLGQAFIIVDKGEPQLQIGWKGFVQLAQRSGQFRTINCSDVREGEILSNDRLTGDIQFKWKDEPERGRLPVVGHVAYFELLNGFRKTLYMTSEELTRHAGKYSQSFKKGFGVWKDNFDAMAQKTVIKLLLNKFAPLSINSELARAIEIDQADSGGDYTDNRPRVQVVDAEIGESEEERSAKK